MTPTAAHYLACDLGAESGRLMLGTLRDGRLELEELHRFPNTPVRDGESLCWDMAALFGQLKQGLKIAAGRQLPITSISTDSWGVDYVRFDASGTLLTPAFHYRDARTARGVEAALARVDWKTIFEETGIQFMPINTCFQLVAESPERLAETSLLLGVGDGFNYLLSGVARVEESMASTFQLYNPRTRTWSAPLLEKLQLPSRLFPPIVPSGTRLGRLRSQLARESGLSEIEVIATCSHDTGTAVAAVPATTKGRWAYLSSGTWSLMGVELPEPIINDRSRQLNFTNEIGFGGSVRFLKNIIGLWLVQECRREWSRSGREFDYATLATLAEAAPPFVSLINPSDDRFLAPGEMPARIAAFCRETGQPVPASEGAMVRCVLESLALLYRRTLQQIESLLGNRIERLHVVGGGSRNALLNQLTADATQVPVFAGPVEATAAGNVLIQAIAMGQLPSLATAREVVAASFPVGCFRPHNSDAWSDAIARFERLFKE